MAEELLHLTIRKNGFVVVGGDITSTADPDDAEDVAKLRKLLKDFALRYGHDVKELEAEVRDSYRRRLFTLTG